MTAKWDILFPMWARKLVHIFLKISSSHFSEILHSNGTQVSKNENSALKKL